MATKNPKTPKTTALVPWEQEMANRAARVKQTEKPWGSFKKISTQGGQLKIDDELVEGNSLRVVVVGWLHENQWYDKPFDPRTPAVPACYAFSDPGADDPEASMVAHAEAERPQGGPAVDEGGANGNPCENCWANVMGSADVGRGKACKNIRRIMVVTEDALESAEALEAAEMRTMNIPVMSTRYWAKFANKVADEMSRDPAGVVCEIALQPDAKSQFVVNFEFQELVNFDQALWTAMEAKRGEAMKALQTPYPKEADIQQTQQPLRPQGRAAKVMAPAKKAPPAGKVQPAKRGKF
jgi:hypothetical protein